ncbi:LuxR C-terminal-related transcriptional regulator [Actinomadura hibisca]|uniref:LuxR C-terminal-related transcriptional regulator n=1 Tax=Actinomadura hibisca TaxID=68565 RepID=UPI00082CED03|nr:LuxR C-terminal-related transcriptional regulator [Actinomadura hibisca]
MTSLNPSTGSDLPAESDAFVGRERDVADLCRLLETLRAVTLCGAGGIGKTRLAVRVARTMLDGGDHPGGVWYADLAEVAADGPPEPVARRVAAVLGVAEERRPLAATLADALGSRGALLVLDNCEHLVAECAELAEILLARCPRLRVLATSREPLRLAGETVWRVPPLEPDEAVRLFVERARVVRPDFAATGSVEEVTRALDGVPLALELAAARVRVLSVEQIAERLGDRFRLLSAGDRTAPPRQRTLRAAIDWSHDLLGHPERVLLRRLSVFSGWTLGQAELVCVDETGGGELPPEDLLDLMTALVDKSLVAVGDDVAGETRFRLLDSIRQYAAERLAEAGETAAIRDRHRDAVLEAAERHAEQALAELPATWTERAALFGWYDAELGNVRAALRWSMDRGAVEEGLRVCTALRTYWIVRGRVTEWAEWTDRFLARAGDLPAYVLGPALAGRAQLAVGGRDFAHAAGFAERALEPCRKAGDDFMTATALITLAEAHTHAGRFAEADARLDEADLLTGGEDQEWNRGYGLTARGCLRLREGRLREAGELLEAGLRVMREIDQLWGAAHALIGLGRLAGMRGDPAAARRHYEAALPALAEVGARPETARALAGIGRVALEQGDLPAARAALIRCLELSRSAGTRLDVARALEAFAELVACEGDARRAVLLAGAAAGMRSADAAGRPAAPSRRQGTGARLERTLEPIRRQFGEPLVAQLWGQGRVTPADDAVTYALGHEVGHEAEPVVGPDGPAVGVPQARQAVSSAMMFAAPIAEPGADGAAAPLAAPSSEPLAAPHVMPPAATPSAPSAVPPAMPSARSSGPHALPPDVPVAAPVTPPSTLTAREREIATLVARGLSNRGIADELVISPATVARHVTNILTKLGFASRAQVAAWAVEHLGEEQRR